MYIRIFLISWFALSGFLIGIAQEKAAYPEIEMYRKTLAPEKVQAYEQVLAKYESETKPEVYPTIKNRNLHNRYQEVMNLKETSAGKLTDKINSFVALSEDAAKKGEKYLEMDCLYQAFMLAFWTEPKNYMRAFEIAIILEEKLAEVTEEVYPNLRAAYFRISEGYYLFKDYEKSIELAKHAITESLPHSFTDQANLNGRKMLAICYGMIGEFDISDQYIFSTFKSPDIVLDRPIYNAVALSHLACNEMDRGEYRKAIALDLVVLPFLRQTNDFGHVAGMYACQCFCYFGLDQPDKVGPIVDSILIYAKQDWYNRNKRLKQAYMNLSRYNGTVENIPKMQEYQDSLVAIFQREEAETASQYILQAETAVAQKKLQSREEELQFQRTIIYVILLILFLSFAFLIIIQRLYRREQAAYKALVEKSEQWTESVYFASSEQQVNKNPASQPDEEDPMIATKLKEYMLENKPYTNPNLTIDSLSVSMGLGRNKLSRAINRTMDKNFNQYINEFRVREVILLMATHDARHSSMDELMEQAGFNGRSSFYQLFKKMTGLTPAQYWKTRNNYPSNSDN